MALSITPQTERAVVMSQRKRGSLGGSGDSLP
jgi:hypothetical protein